MTHFEFKSAESIDDHKEIVLNQFNKEVNLESLLDRYGPQGLYIIANKLTEIADKDMSDALNEFDHD